MGMEGNEMTIETPEDWKKLRGRAGYFHRPFEDCTLIHAPRLRLWWLEARRGPESACDWWGPWTGDDEARIIPAVQALHADLTKVGWLDRTATDWKRDALIDRLPRSKAIPDYLLIARDERALARGKARKKDLLQVGGADLHLDMANSYRRPGLPPTSVRLIAKPAGNSPCTHESIFYRLDMAGVDAMIDFLLDVRDGMISPEAEAAIESVQDTVRGDLPPPGDPKREERIRERHRASALAGKASAEILQAANRHPELLALWVFTAQALDAGDRIVSLGIGPGGETGPMDVAVDPRSKMGRRMRAEAATQAHGRG